MKHFVVIIHYIAPSEEVAKLRPAHRVFLQTGYDASLLLMSGPRNPCTDGIAIARAESPDEIISFFKKDPYQMNNLASYEFIEFEPVKNHPMVHQWVNPKESIRTTE